MSVGDGQEHDELRQVVREFLRQRSPSREVRRLMEAGEGRDTEVWAMLTGQLGLSGIAVPARYGGAGYGPVELGIVVEEMGRALLVAPYFSTVVLAGQALAASGDEGAMARWLPGIADGSLTAALAVAEESGSWDLADITAAAEPAAASGDGWTVSGTKLYVVDGHTADLLLVVARTPGGHGVFAVEGDDPGVERARVDALDLTRPLASVTLRDARAVRVGAGRDTAAWLSEVTDLVLAALAAEQLGGAARCLELSVEYAKVREQFGRPIGSFQAIKHKCATLFLEVESGRSAGFPGDRGARRPRAGRVARGGARLRPLFGRLHPRRQGVHPDPRRYRLHLGARRAPVPQAGEVVRALPRPARAPARPASRAGRDLRDDDDDVGTTSTGRRGRDR